MSTSWSVAMPALTPGPTPVREDDALVRVLEAHIETLKAENEILRRPLAAAEGGRRERRSWNGSTRWRPIGSISWRPSAPGRGGGEW